MRSPSVMLSPEHILRTGFGYCASRTLLSAVEVGLFTELGKGPRSNRQLRRTLGLSQSAVAALLEPLVALGFLEREGDDAGAVYVNSRESGHFLDSNSPGYLGEVLLQNARPRAAAQPESKSLARGLLTIATALLVDRFDFSRFATLLDLGSARGGLARVVAARHAHLRYVRISQRRGSWPDADVIVAPLTLGQLDANGRTRLIQRAHQSLSPGGCLIAMEFLAGEDRRGSASPLAMLLGSKPRTLGWSDLDDDCRAAGFERTELLPLVGPLAAMLAYRSH